MLQSYQIQAHVILPHNPCVQFSDTGLPPPVDCRLPLHPLFSLMPHYVATLTTTLSSFVVPTAINSQLIATNEYLLLPSANMYTVCVLCLTASRKLLFPKIIYLLLEPL